MLNIKIVSWSLGIFTAISFVLCVIYGLIVPQSLHSTQFLEGWKAIGARRDTVLQARSDEL